MEEIKLSEETNISEWDKVKSQIEIRKYDSEDAIRIRSHGIVAATGGDMKVVKIDTGMMQKVSIVCGVRKCPWFSDSILDRDGVTEQIFQKRMYQEFRKVPVDVLDQLFRAVQEMNKSTFDKVELQKN